MGGWGWGWGGVGGGVRGGVVVVDDTTGPCKNGILPLQMSPFIAAGTINGYIQ